MRCWCTQVAAAHNFTGWDQAHVDVPCTWTRVNCTLTPGFVTAVSAGLDGTPGDGVNAPFIDLNLTAVGLQGGRGAQ